MKFRWDSKYFYWGMTGFLVIAASLLFYFGIFRMGILIDGIKKILNILMPILYGAAIAYLLNPLLKFYENTLVYPFLKEKKVNITKRKCKFIRYFGVLLAAGTGSFEDECFIKAGETIQNWVEKGYFPEGCNSLSEDDGQARQMLYQETAAMSLAGSWYTSMMQQDSKEFAAKMGWFAFPAADDANTDASILIGTVGDNFISFNCEGEKLEAAFECATKFSEDDQIDFMIESGKIPPIKGVDEKLSDETSKTIMQAVNNASAVQLWYDQYLPPAVASVHLDTCQEIFGLTMTPEEAAKQFQQAMEEYNADKAE